MKEGYYMKKSVYLRMFSFICAVVMACSLMALPVSARTKEEVQAEIQQKKALIEKLEKKISDSQNDKEAQKKALVEFEKQYKTMLGLLDEQAQQIANTKTDLDNKTKELADTIIKLQDSKKLFEERLMAIYYMNDSNAVLEAFLAVESFSQFIQLSDTMQRIAKNDTTLIKELGEEQEKYEQQKATLEETIVNLNDELAEMEQNRDWYKSKMNETSNKITQLNNQIASDQLYQEKTEQEQKELQKEYNAIMAQHTQKGSQKGDGSNRPSGPLKWPCNGRLTSGYGDPRSNTGWHYGIDIVAPSGTPIIAAADGTVMTATSHYSYGNYIVIDHNDGLRTLYAHCSSLAVGAGAQVAAGDTIAYVGSTGDSTGAHLHFEVFDGGSRVNPMGSGYLSP